MTQQKLNIFQCGILQVITILFVGLASFTFCGIIVYWLDGQLLKSFVHQAQQQDLITLEVAKTLNDIIEGRDFTIIFVTILATLGCVAGGWVFMRWAAKLNWSWPVTLPRAVEFRAAMEQLGIVAPDDRIDFVRKHKLPIFLAHAPLVGGEVGGEAVSVCARLYVFAHHRYFSDKNIFEQHTGNQTLCLNAEDYERLLEEHGHKTDLAYSARIATLEEANAALAGVNSLHLAKIEALKEENEKLQEENTDFRNKQRTAPARDGRAEKLEQDRIPFYRVVWATINALLAKAVPGTKYTRPQIQSAFGDELENFPELKAAIKKLLATDRKEENNAPYALEGWGMEYIRDKLGNFVKRTAGSPNGVKKY